MRDGRARVCVATDVAARGIDLPNLDLVVHAELPNNHETLLYRSGRTGRAGRKGVSVLIVPPSVRRKAERILRSAKLTAKIADAPSADAVRARDQERMMADPAWQEPVTEREQAAVAQLVEQFDAQHLAAAYLRLYNSRQSAPEELSAAGAGAKSEPRAPFGPSVWFSITGGRATGAEPRRLMPMLCKAGNITKDDLGAIRIQETESFVELREAAVTGFVAALNGKTELEPGATLKKLNTPPDIAGSPRPKYNPKNRNDKGRKPKSSAAPVDWNDDPTPRNRKPKSAPHRKTAKPERAEPNAVVDPWKKRKPRSDDKPKGPPPPKGKSNSKKNQARKKVATTLKRAAKKGKGARPT